MILALCIKCGTEKMKAINTCSSCGFDPRLSASEYFGKSIYLSVERDPNLDPEEYQPDLVINQETLRRGGRIQYDQEILSEIIEIGKNIEDVRIWAIFKYALRLFGPPVLILISIFFVGWLIGKI